MFTGWLVGASYNVFMDRIGFVVVLSFNFYIVATTTLWRPKVQADQLYGGEKESVGQPFFDSRLTPRGFSCTCVEKTPKLDRLRLSAGQTEPIKLNRGSAVTLGLPRLFVGECR